ncbi:hypothetical protein ABKA04_004686 [Annulohypoxylon sp. FPYF3050]
MLNLTKGVVEECVSIDTPLSDGVPSTARSYVENDHLEQKSESGSTEPIAIIGMSCRLAGDAKDVPSLWNMLLTKRTAWTPSPGRRFNMKAFQDPSGNKSGTTNTGGGHFLKDDVAAFDAAFFGINPLEASAMDPQHRLLLQIAYETFQNAGLSLESVSGSRTGVYVGQWSTDYHEIQTRDIDSAPLYLVTGTGPAISSNRISYTFDLRGPSITVDTGCSSSLVALHQAIQSLRAGESLQCFVGGVNLLLDPQRFTYQSRLKMFSKEGRSFAFDSRANGYGRGEGCTGIMIKPLSAALRDGDHIRAVIRNSALNQDGRTPGINVPSAAAQKDAILTAYRQAMLDIDIDYVEAHGTGTKVGDPIEARAIASALASGRSALSKLPIGSIKGNIGHTEGAAGLAGLIKAVLMLEKGCIPPQANYEVGNPDIPLDEWNLRIPTELENRKLRRISVNSFGYGGTNAHVVVDSIEAVLSSSPRLLPNGGIPLVVPFPNTMRIFFISAASKRSCKRMCSGLARYLVLNHRTSTDANTVLARLSYSLAVQTIHPHRLTLVASTIDGLVGKLTMAAQSVIPRRDKRDGFRLAFVFSGQGAQYPEMGCELLKYHPSFSHSIERARQHLFRLGSRWDLLTEIHRSAEQSKISNPDISQPATTAIQLALVDLLAEFNILPCSVLGHSSGEIAAGYAAGLISFEDAISAAYFRGKLVHEMISKQKGFQGAMIAVGSSPESVEAYISRVGPDNGHMRIACFNSPSSVTVSGNSKAIDKFKAILDEEGIFNRMLPTNGAAYHSQQMNAIEDQYKATLKAHTFSQENESVSVRMFSSVTGKELQRTALDPDYWANNLINPVLFSQACRTMFEQKFDGFPLNAIVEIGPHCQLRGPVNQILKIVPRGPAQGSYTSTLKRDMDAQVSLLECLGFIQVQSGSLPLRALNGEGSKSHDLLVDLPPYPFDNDRTFWHETRISKDYRHREHLPHNLLGNLSLDVNRQEPRWRNLLSLKSSPWLRGHIVQGQIVFPAAGYITMAIQATRQHFHMHNPNLQPKSLSFRNISINKAIVLSDDRPEVELAFSLRPMARTARESSNVWNEFRIFVVSPDDKWTEHCRGLVHAEADSAKTFDAKELNEITEASKECIHQTNCQKFYYLLQRTGLEWLQPFRNVSILHTGQDTSIVTNKMPAVDADLGGMGDILHPGMLDSCLFHGLYSIMALERGINSTAVPNFIRDLWIANHAPEHSDTLVSTSLRRQDDFTYDVVVQEGSNPKGEIVLAAQGVHTVKLPGDESVNQTHLDNCNGIELVTYVDAWSPKHRDQVCKSMIRPENCVEENQFLDALTYHYVQEAIKRVNVVDIPQGHRRRFYDWMQQLVKNSPEASPLPEDAKGLSISSFGEAAMRLGPNLPDILRQRADPLALLTPDNLLARIYNSDCFRRSIVQIAQYCHELGRQNPSLRVLEVGAGTASATELILQALTKRGGRYVSRYDFTDISPGFFVSAKERLGDLSDVVEFSTLDIERSAQEQGLEEASYDLIIASNVIHATRRIDVTLANIRALLKPGGKFILMELTRATPHYGLLFGVFEGWWAGYDDGRQLSPLLPVPEWLKRLKLAGFSNPEACFENYPESEGGTGTVFVTSAPQLATEDHLLPIYLVTTPCSSTSTQIWVEREALIRDIFPKTKVSKCVLSSSPPGGGVVILLPDIGRVLCNEPDETSWNKLKSWILRADAVIAVSSGTMENDNDVYRGLWPGFIRCVRLEHPSIPILTLDIECESSEAFNELANVLPTLVRNIEVGLGTNGPDSENEYFSKGGQLFVPRVMPQPEASNHIRRALQQAEPEMTQFHGINRSLVAELSKPGLMETLRWRDNGESPDLCADQIRLELRAASVNFKDVLIAAGQLEGINEMCNDCSGVVVAVGEDMRDRFKPGDRVYALYSQSYANYPVVHGDCCRIIPKDMSFEEAASLPIVWTTVYYSLVDMGRLSAGDKVLIHSAAGAVGQAAIMLSQHLRAEVFVTVSSSSKRELLHKRYGIPRDHMFSSRTTEFYDCIKRMTAGRGVDVVLNSLSGEMFRYSTNILAPFGRFVEIGRKDLMDDVLMPMGFLLNNVTLAYVDLSLIIEQNKPLAKRLLADVESLMTKKSIRPVMLTTMPISDIETAFRLIQAGKHTGKIILRVEPKQQVKAIPPAPPPVQLSGNATFAVVGGFGGLGFPIITWLAEHGARSIMVLSRSGASQPQSQSFIKEIEAKGVRVVASRCDVASKENVELCIEEAARAGLPPIRGVIQSAMVLRDSMFEQMDSDQWRGALAPKLKGTMNLHRCFGGELDFFIVLSSAVAICGNVGQSNYAAACSFQDFLMQHRVAVGLSGFSINVGAVLEAGFVSENPKVASSLQRQGLGSVRLSCLLAMLNYAIHRSHSGKRAPAKSVCALGLLPNSNSISPDDGVSTRGRRFAHLANKANAGVNKAEGKSSDVLQQLGTASKFEDAVSIVCQAIMQQLSKLIATPVEALSPSQGLDRYGLDSLVAVELRNWIRTFLQAEVPLMVLRGTGSIQELSRIVTNAQFV